MKPDHPKLLLPNAPGGSSAQKTRFLQVEGLSKRFGTQTVLDQLDLEVIKGEFVCLLGPSGCGKTTLLRQIAGLDAPDSGRIRMAGRDVTTLPPAHRDYGIVFQSYALFPNLTVEQNIGYGLRGRKEDRQRRIGELLALIGLEPIASRYPAQLSGGQQQRVALARALATAPSLLLLDEPLSALDARVREHLRKEIRALQQKLAITTVMVTHDQEEALLMADRIVVMNGGRIEQCGSPAEVYREPATAFVADFLGQSNWLPVRAIDAEQIELGGQPLQVAHRLANGEQGLLFVRPEDVVVHAVWPTSTPSVLAELDKIELLGPLYRLQLRVPGWGAALLQADLDHARLATLAARPGSRLPISLNGARVRVFAGKGGRA
ncbi:putative 2-aminoethylphosphonate ABC transporter ATP-binding protein [Rhodobacteraceae bacterium CH30]|nr:putative 2-aminoethylphosphonate ABC transporter ATP-binding protein [Rhodobacteraceae bacterium CH30]